MANAERCVKGAIFYVAQDGNDAWSGKLDSPNADKTDGPFATIARAVEAIRQLKKDNTTSEALSIVLRDGIHFLDKPITLTQIDGGSNICPITYMAYPGEKPIISGGKKITGTWKTYKDQIMVCNISEVKEGKWKFNQLFVNGKRQTRARIPHDDYYYIEKAVSPTSFQYKEDEFKRWQNLNEVEVVFFHSWNETRFIVSELDENERIVKFLDPKAMHVIGWEGTGGPNRYYIENIIEGLQQPGDWYLNTHTGDLYYWCIDDIDKLEIIAPVLNELIRLEGGLKEQHIQNVIFRGITFAHTDWKLPENGYPDCGDVGDIVHPSAITWENARYCSMQDCCIRNVATYALEMTGYGNSVINCHIYDTGSGGIVSRNYNEERNVFMFNHIHNCGEVYPSAVAINIDDGGGTVSHNLIHDITQSGVYTRHWGTETQSTERANQEQGLLIEYNEIYNCCTRISDDGGLFVRDSNIIIRNNLIHDCYSYGGRCPGWGIYLGCETRDTIVENNIVYRADEVVHVWFSDRNIVMQNNIFIGGRLDQICYQNPSDRSHENIKTLRNIFYYTKPSVLFALSHEKCLPAESDYNLYFCTAGELTISGISGVSTFADWQAKGFDKNSVVANPLFVDPDNDDYSLRTDSPAFKLGFKPIDMSRVGIR
jgi:hypothetical protein